MSLVRVAIGDLQGPCIQQYGVNDQEALHKAKDVDTESMMPAVIGAIDVPRGGVDSETKNVDQNKRSESGRLRPVKVAAATGESNIFGVTWGKPLEGIDKKSSSELGEGDSESGKALYPGQWRALRDDEVTRLFEHALARQA